MDDFTMIHSEIKSFTGLDGGDLRQSRERIRAVMDEES